MIITAPVQHRIRADGNFTKRSSIFKATSIMELATHIRMYLYLGQNRKFTCELNYQDNIIFVEDYFSSYDFAIHIVGTSISTYIKFEQQEYPAEFWYTDFRSAFQNICDQIIIARIHGS